MNVRRDRMAPALTMRKVYLISPRMRVSTVAQLLDQLELTRLRLAPDGVARSDLGQVLTPAPLARLMAGLFELPRTSVALLDPGAGIGTLCAAAVIALCERAEPPRTITITAIELDERLTPHLADALSGCAELCAAAGIVFDATLVSGDFLTFAAAQLEPIFAQDRTGFDVAILNPPYRKIQTASRERRLLSHLGIEVSNLYAGFMALAVKLLGPGGELVAISPRSFCNGPYFRPFRELLLSHAALKSFYLFDTRQEALRRRSPAGDRDHQRCRGRGAAVHCHDCHGSQP